MLFRSRHRQLEGEVTPLGHHADGTQKLVAMVERACFVPAPFPGHYEPLMECGEYVDKGKTVGLLHDFYHIDDDAWPVKAGVEGYVLCQASRAPVPQGLHILVIAQEVR